MQPETAGDPMTGLKWTRKTTERIAKALRQQGLAVGRSTVGRLLTQMDFRLRVNHKKRSTAAPKDRDQQFRVIGRRRHRCARARDPIVSIDCKKKELVGNFTNAGAAGKQHRIETLATDFRSDATGVAVPYGLYDTEANRGLVVVGTCRETPTFVTDCVATWWKTEGRTRYPTSRRLLILADGGGGNRATCHVWHTGLQATLCDRYGLTVTVSHYPRGHRSGTPSSTGYSAGSAPTGKVSHWRPSRRAHSRFPGAVCRQRWTVRLGEVELVFGQTGRMVLDITARDAHDGALKWTTAPSTPRAARSI